MRFRTKLAVIALVPITDLAFAVTTPEVEPKKPSTTRQKVVEWVKTKGKETLKDKAKDFAYDEVKEKFVDAVMDRGEHWFGGPFRKRAVIMTIFSLLSDSSSILVCGSLRLLTIFKFS